MIIGGGIISLLILGLSPSEVFASSLIYKIKLSEYRQKNPLGYNAATDK
jgi:hypothetical protein